MVFIDGGGNLVVANADGCGQTEAAHNPGGQKWSHPTWQTTQADRRTDMPARNNIFFASTAGGGTLWEVSTDAHNAKPTQLTLNGYSGQREHPAGRGRQRLAFRRRPLRRRGVRARQRFVRRRLRP